MKKSFLLLLLFASLTHTQAAHNAKTGDLQFVQNNGQWAGNILYSADIYGGTMFLENNCFTYSFSNAIIMSEFKHKGVVPDRESFTMKKHAYRTSFMGANQNPVIVGENKFGNYFNYFQGNDQSRWKGNVPAFGAVRYQNIYPQTDLLVYSQSNSLKYDFVLAPGADASKITLLYEGLDGISLKDGALELLTSLNTIVELKPIAWQIIGGVKTPVVCEYLLDLNMVSFSFPNGYDKNYELIIDPATLIFSSFTGSTADNWGYSATYDLDGNLYGGGITFGDGYPVTLGAFQTDYVPGVDFYVADVTISKFSADGTSLIYSTYLGGSNNDLPYSLIVNEANELLVYGSTGSDDLPVTAGAYDESFNGGSFVTVDFVLDFTEGSDAFITKFSADGGSLIGSTYFGGTGNDAVNEGAINYNYGDHARGEINLDQDENIVIASATRSTNLPVSATAFQATNGGQQDGFIAKFNETLTTLVFSSYIGGSGSDGAYGIKQMNPTRFVICGGTTSTNFPTTAGSLNPTYKGGTADGFVITINADASDLVAGTYIGTNQYDQTFLTEIDAAQNIYITGQTRGAYPIVGTVYENPGSAQYISKLDSTLSTILLSTVFGSGTNQVNISPTAFLVDNCDYVYVCGWGGGTNQLVNFEAGTVDGMDITGDAFQSSTDGSDLYLIVFEEGLTDLKYATYFGGPFAEEHVDGGTSRFDKQGVVYHAVCASCGGSDDFPTTEGVVSNTNNSTNCNLGVFKFSLAPPSTAANFTADPMEGCYPLDVDLTNSSSFAASYFWDFGDGTTSTEENPDHVYNTPGTYTVTLVAYVDGDCGINDTSELEIVVFDYPVADFDFGPDPASLFAPVVFENQSIDDVSWLWEFGDGTISTEENPNHTYAEVGAYEVCLTVYNSDSCENKTCDTVIIEEFSLLDVPNAFSPNGDGVNDQFMPLNYGLEDYQFAVYNRWGELLFLTSSTVAGWNGIYEGKLQEIGTYVYVVSGKGVDNVNYYKQGNFTLVL
jgi:gliding motility-associated-like protein